MKRTITLTIVVIAMFMMATVFSGARTNDFPLGTTLEDFKLKNTDGVEKSFKDLAGEKGTIIVFLSAQCPVVRGYNERLKQIALDYKSKGISVIGMNSNSTESLETVRDHAKEHYPFLVLIDTDNVIADKLNANATPEIFLFDKDSKLIYHGGIDNDRSGENITNNFLRTALDEHLGGKAVSKSETRAFGCSIKRKNG